MKKKVYFLFFLVLCSCSPGSEIQDKHEWSLLQSAEWNLKEKDNKSGVFITKLPGYENKILAIPVDGKEIGFNVILLDSKNPNTVKYMSRYNFKIPQKYRADSVKMSEKYPEVHKFVESH